jgi:hypothetical protein
VRRWLLGIVLVACAHKRPADDGFEPVRETAIRGPAGSSQTRASKPPRPPNTIYRTEIDRALGPGPGYLLGQLGPEPYRPSGAFVGWRITRVFPDDPDLCAADCDLRMGDIIWSVNGTRLETPQALSDAVATLQDARTLEVVRLRGGERERVVFAIVD